VAGHRAAAPHLDEPPRIDGAKADIQRKVVELAREGLSVIFSSEPEEVVRPPTHRRARPA
jgi:ABC-type sugar transport system ATPase subunit